MSQGEVRKDPVDATRGDDGSQPDLSNQATQRYEEIVAKFKSRLRKFAEECAAIDACDDVQKKHIDLAEETVYRAGTRMSRFEPKFFMLLGGIALSLALALPDSGQMFWGPPDGLEGAAPHQVWWYLKIAFCILVTSSSICGILAAGGIIWTVATPRIIAGCRYLTNLFQR